MLSSTAQGKFWWVTAVPDPLVCPGTLLRAQELNWGQTQGAQHQLLWPGTGLGRQQSTPSTSQQGWEAGTHRGKVLAPPQL